MKKIAGTIVIFIVLSLNAFAEEKKVVFEVGGGGKYYTEIYKGGKENIVPMPFISARYGKISFEFDKLKLYFNEDLSLTAGIGNYGYNNIEGMDDRKMSIVAGIDYNLKIVLGTSIKMNINENFFEDENGLSGEILGEQIIPVSDKDYIFILGGTKIIDRSVADYYYGVKESEMTRDMKSYNGKTSFIPGVQLKYVKIFNPNVYMFIVNKANFYTKEITDSPIVDKNYDISSVFGVMYKFK